MSRMLCLMVFTLAHLLPFASGQDYIISDVEDSISKWNKLQADFWSWNIKISPELATEAGVNYYNDRLNSYTKAVYEQKKADIDVFLGRLQGIDKDKLDKRASINFAILQNRLATFSEGFKWHQYGPLNPISIASGPQRNTEHLISLIPFHNRGDFENFIQRLQKLPNQFHEWTENMKKAVEMGTTFHNVSIESVPSELDEMIPSDPEQSVYYQPFKATLDGIQSISTEDKNGIRARARVAVEHVITGLATLRSYITNEYIQHTRPNIGVSTLKDGYEFYKACLKWHTSVDISPEEVHQMGLDEIAKVKKRMEKVVREVKFNGTSAEFVANIKRQPRFYLNSPDHLLEEFSDMIDKRIAPKLSTYFKDVPKRKVRVQPSSSQGPIGQYIQGSSDGTKPGTFVVNLPSYDRMPTFMMMSLTLHETLPGHHLQWMYQMNSPLPKFRIYPDTTMSDVPLTFPHYTAYVEGWGLYAEYLGEEMGVYKDEYELMGRLGGEMFRACRLVVDTGIHVFNWTKDEAKEFILTQTSTSVAMAEYEVNRYITLPGQACAYKIGELKIHELRAKAEKELGAKFDIKEFHHVVLDNGPVPLSLLETVVDNWIIETKSASNAEQTKCVSMSTGLVPGILLMLFSITLVVTLRAY
ncbi:hypothetical protein ScPMuIL_018392 [Solemya velum]